MKIFRLCPTPSHALEIRDIYRLSECAFADQLQIYRSENLLLPGGWANCMEKEGFEVFETCCNDMLLQEAWALENHFGHLVRDEDSLFKIVEAQIKWFKPDILFLYAGASFIFSREMRVRLRKSAPQDMTIVIFWGDEIPSRTTYEIFFGDIDFAFCSSKIYQENFARAGIDAVTIGNAFDPSIKFTAPVKKTHNFIFCGTAGFCIPEHWNRYNFLRKLLEISCLEIYTKERDRFPHKHRTCKQFVCDLILSVAIKLPSKLILVLSKIPRLGRLMNLALQAKRSGLSIEDLQPLGIPQGEHPDLGIFKSVKPLSVLFPDKVRPPKTLANDYFNLIAETKLVLNVHREEDADIGNIRCFEVTGVGSCLVTNHREGLRDFFDVDNDIVTFETAEECAEKVKYLLNHPNEMMRIAQNGNKTTLKHHTVAERCKKIAEILRLRSIVKNSKRNVLVATYDLESCPLSYDIAFFIQAAEVTRQNLGCESISLTILAPLDIDNQAGVSKEVYSVVDGRAREFRINNICLQMGQLMPTIGSVTVKYRNSRDITQEIHGVSVSEYPIGKPAHNEHYKLLNQYSEQVTGFSASIEAHRIVNKWLKRFSAGRKVICISLRQYKVDIERNSNIWEWAKFAEFLDKREYAVVVVPDTDHLADFYESPLSVYPAFEPACFLIDLRMALYELAYLNMFVSNGPAYAATLFKKINYLMFKITHPDVLLASPDVLKWLGYKIGGSPKYATPFQRWVWESDTADVLYREFMVMDRLLRTYGPTASIDFK